MTDEKPAEDEKPAKRAPRRKAEGEICPQCWPNGWPAEDATSAVCDHGTYNR